ncbi:D-3-phosphoglycerate dehydrogenase 2 [Mucor velutinosus]|uniref:Required for respiratory growth protein 9, mitochondrial n=1 Tax=Mucor velutinosus TaxID=708070 RepID=A0AAN7DS12_9FUNG|nr:D-3-phosphoglycerate dehydrogenase 2 [Mucor velutinosus]
MFKSIFRLKPANARFFSSETGASTAAASNWAPKKRVSRPTMEKIRALAATQPEVYNAVTLSKEFKLSVEGIRRILKSKYVPEAQDGERQERNRYEAMGERRKEFKKTYNIPEGNPKKFWDNKTNGKVQDISTKRQERSTSGNKWSNDVYNKRRSFDDDESNLGYRRSSRFSREIEQQGRGAYNGDRQRSYSNERVPFKKSFDNEDIESFNKNFKGSNGERGSFTRHYNNEDRRSFRRNYNNEDKKSQNRGSYANERRQPFEKENDVERRSFNRRFDGSDGDRRSFKKDDNNAYYNREGSYGEKKSFKRENDSERRPNRFNDEKPFRSHKNQQNRRPFNRQASWDDNQDNAAGDRGFKSD